MSTRFRFPPVNLGAPLEPQMVNRAHWVGYMLARNSASTKWQLARTGEVFLFDSLLEVDMKLEQILEAIGDRVEKQLHEHLRASRQVHLEAQRETGAR